MGVPKFYRWLSERYPLINQMISNGTMLPEIDNFYLDMNGIIHACTHPNDDNETAVKLSQRDMMLAIFRYIDRCVSLIVKPKKLLFLAIDGCAPRAKLNQQRSRRFRAGQEREENMQKSRQRGEIVDEAALFDSNCITPGTEFMEIVDRHLRYYIHKKIKEDPVWRDLEVIYSGHDVPGEGEHKIIEWIRNERAKPGYQPNIRHCLYGQDADLIMLGLGTHEPHFTLLREVVDFGGGRRGMGARQTVMKQTQDSKFQLLHLSTLREYIEVEFSHKHTGGALDIERLVDDFIFLTFLVGNDFLPHLPTLDIGENGFDVIFDVYKQMQQEEVGYLVENGELSDLNRLEKLFQGIGLQESNILETRELEQKEFNEKKRKRNRGRGGDPSLLSLEEEEAVEEELLRAMDDAIAEAMSQQDESDGASESKGGEKDVQQGNDWTEKKGRVESKESVKGKKSKEEVVINKAGKDYRARYYFSKFRMTPVNEADFLAGLTEEYLKGLMWCLAYYFKGCVSWTWYFPYYYGPMLADMKDLTAKSSRISFDLGKPFLPYQQLLGCLPPTSKALIPLPYQWLMTSDNSPLKDSYPMDFEIDMNGKRNPWEAVVLLPFMDASRLLEGEAAHCQPGLLTPRERARNVFGSILHYRFDPSNNKTVPTCNADIGLTDILNCQTTVAKHPFNLSPGVPFSPQLIPGTVRTCAGFPSLGVVPIKSVSFEAVKLNIFGSDSKYKSVIIHILIRAFDDKTIDMKVLLNRSIFVNYPLLHEAKVVGVSSESKSYVIKKKKKRDANNREFEEEVIEERLHDDFSRMQWRKESADEESKYLKGRGIPGTGGIGIEEVKMRLQVVPLQGMKVDRETGARTKVFGTSVTDIPIQMALWTSPVVDKRFEERAEQSVESMFPLGTTVVATSGPFFGKLGRVMGPHKEIVAGERDSLGSNSVQQTGKARTVDVEFTVHPPEPPFGYALNISISDEYLSSREVCKLLGITPSILGTIVGGLFLSEPRGADIGLDLKKNHEYQLLGYCRQVAAGTYKGSKGPTKPKLSAWGTGDTVQIIGSAVEERDNKDEDNATGGVQWEYSDKTVQLVSDYMQAFPVLFRNLQRLPNQRRYTVQELFGTSGGADDGYAEGVAVLDRVMLWMKQQPYFHQPRSPFTTLTMSKDAIRAVERASDVLVSNLQQPENCKKIIRKGVPVSSLYRGDDHSPYDSPLELEGQNTETSASNPLASATQALPELGDRVINLVASGVPFGLRGTVVGIHSASAYVEVLFDEEFGNGKSLQGLCSQFRGALVPWVAVLRVSNNSLSTAPPTASSTAQKASSSGGKSSSSKHVKGQMPPPIHAKGTPKPKPVAKEVVKEAPEPKSTGITSTTTKEKVKSTASPNVTKDNSDGLKDATKVTGILRRELQGGDSTTSSSGSTDTVKKSGMINITGVLQRSGLVSPSPPIASTLPPPTATVSMDMTSIAPPLPPASNNSITTTASTAGSKPKTKPNATAKPSSSAKAKTSSATAVKSKNATSKVDSVDAVTEALKKSSVSASKSDTPPPVPPVKDNSAGAGSITSKLLKAKAKMRASMDEKNVPTASGAATGGGKVQVSPPTSNVKAETKKSSNTVSTSTVKAGSSSQAVPSAASTTNVEVEKEKKVDTVTETKPVVPMKLMVPSRVVMKKKK